MTSPLPDLETVLATRLGELPGYNTTAPDRADLTAGYVLFTFASDIQQGQAETGSGTEHAARYLIKATASRRAHAFALLDAAVAALAAPITIPSGDVWSVRIVNRVVYPESMPGGSHASHAGAIYLFNITET